MNKIAYETVMVISTKLGEEGIANLVAKIQNLIASHGEIEGDIQEWGKRRLAYEIDDQMEGYYVLINFISDTDFPAELDRIYKITDGILRSLIVRKD